MESLSLVQHRWVQGWHINASGHLFGGHLVSWVDEDAMMLASMISSAKAIFTTAGFERVSFEMPVYQGDRLRFQHDVIYAGRTSLWTKTEVLSHDEDKRVFFCFACICCVDSLGKPVRIDSCVDSQILDAIPRGEYWNYVEVLRELRGNMKC